MATKKITFDPDSGVPYGANLTIYGGANFNAHFEVVDTSGAAFNFTGWTASSQMVKSIVSEGRYMYNILVSSGTTTYNLVNGNVLVYEQISSPPS